MSGDYFKYRDALFFTESMPPVVYTLTAGEDLSESKGIRSGMVAIGDTGKAVQYVDMFEQTPIGFITKDYKKGEVVKVIDTSYKPVMIEGLMSLNNP